MTTTSACPVVARWVTDWSGPLGHRLADDRTPEPGDDPAGREPEISLTPCPDGPLLVRGPVTVVGPDGEPVPRRRATVALCRCGGTAIPPWCDGTHKVNGFRSDD